MKHPWWHRWFFTELILIKSETANFRGARTRTKETYRCHKCKKDWDVDPDEGYEFVEEMKGGSDESR